jgi:hypothetical protein
LLEKSHKSTIVLGVEIRVAVIRCFGRATPHEIFEGFPCDMDEPPLRLRRKVYVRHFVTEPGRILTSR